MRKSSITLIIILLCIFIISCVKKKEYKDVNIQAFKEQSIITNQKVIFYTNFKVKNSDLYTFSFTKNNYTKALEMYRHEPNLAIVFLVECKKSDSSKIKEIFADWGYSDKLIIKEYEKFPGGMTLVSYILNNNGEVIAVTNPSLGNEFYTAINKQLN